MHQLVLRFLLYTSNDTHNFLNVKIKLFCNGRHVHQIYFTIEILGSYFDNHCSLLMLYYFFNTEVFVCTNLIIFTLHFKPLKCKVNKGIKFSEF